MLDSEFQSPGFRIPQAKNSWIPDSGFRYMGRNENKLSQTAYNDIKWNENKALWSKKIKSLLEQIGLGEPLMKAYYADIGIVNLIRQRLKDIELQ